MTATATAAGRARALTDQQVDQVRERGPDRQGQRDANKKSDIQRPAVRAVRVHDVLYLAVIGVGQLTWIAALMYGIIRLVS